MGKKKAKKHSKSADEKSKATGTLADQTLVNPKGMVTTIFQPNDEVVVGYSDEIQIVLKPLDIKIRIVRRKFANVLTIWVDGQAVIVPHAFNFFDVEIL